MKTKIETIIETIATIVISIITFAIVVMASIVLIAYVGMWMLQAFVVYGIWAFLGAWLTVTIIFAMICAFGISLFENER